MTLEEATDILNGQLADWPEETQAALTIALDMIEQYQISIRERGLDKEGFCQGSYFKRMQTLLYSHIREREI